MTALAEPPHRWNAKTATAEALGTLRPAGYRKGRWLVKADVPALKPHHGFQIADLRAFFQGAFSGCRVRLLNRGA